MPVCTPLKTPHLKRLASVAIIVLSALALPAIAAADEGINVVVDEAKMVRFDKPIAQVIVGNPAIADVTVQDRRTLVFTGKSAGHTNIILLDEGNHEILNKKVYVSTSLGTGVVIVHRGTVRSSYQCGSICNGRVALGDDKSFTSDILASTEQKLKFARDAASGR